MNRQNSLATELETRREKRHVPTQTITAYDTLSNRELGCLANITHDGLMLVSKTAIETNRIYQISLQLPVSILNADSIDIVIDCLWSKPAESQAIYWAGCSIIDADQTASSVIDKLIASYSE